EHAEAEQQQEEDQREADDRLVHESGKIEERPVQGKACRDSCRSQFDSYQCSQPNLPLAPSLVRRGDRTLLFSNQSGFLVPPYQGGTTGGSRRLRHSARASANQTETLPADRAQCGVRDSVDIRRTAAVRELWEGYR